MEVSRRPARLNLTQLGHHVRNAPIATISFNASAPVALPATHVGRLWPSPNLLPNPVGVIQVRIDPDVTGYGQSASPVCRDPSGRHSFSRPCVTCAQACMSVARELEGNLDVAANTAGCKCKVDRTPELSLADIPNHP